MQTAERFRVVDVDGAAVHHDLLGAGFQQSFSSGLYSKTSRIRLRADLTRSIPDVDRVRGEALAETLQSSHRAAQLDDRRLEVATGLAEPLGDEIFA